MSRFCEIIPIRGSDSKGRRFLETDLPYRVGIRFLELARGAVGGF